MADKVNFKIRMPQSSWQRLTGSLVGALNDNQEAEPISPRNPLPVTVINGGTGGTLNAQPATQITTTSALTIPSGTSLSSAVDLTGRSVVRMSIGPAWTAADLTVQVSSDGQNWLDLYDEYGTPYTIKAAANRAVYIPPGPFLAVNWVRFRSGTPSAPISQSAEATIRLASVPL